MKKMLFAAIFVVVCAFLIVSCFADGTQSNTNVPVSKNLFINDSIEVNNLLEKYNLSLRPEWFIWNDYMPGGKPYSKRDSICTIWITSQVKIPAVEVFATIITERSTLPVSFYDIYNGEGMYGNLFLKDFRPVNGFRLDDGEEYNIEIIIKINGEYQVILFENQIVYDAH